jgi:replicative DNA helicase
MKAGKTHLFNVKSYKAATQPIFIVEGELDALSIIQAGGVALSIGGTEGAKEFVSLLKIQPPKQRLIIALDNDGPGKKASQKLAKTLDDVGLTYAIPSYIYGECKDANELLTKNPATLTAAIQKEITHEA